jgi:hypothetical protein
MADILVVDWTTVSEVTKGSFMEGLELTSYADGSTLDLSANRYESIGGVLYLVSGGNVSVDTSAATIDGTYYVHVKDDGDQTASAFLDSNAGTFNGELGGYYYNGGKVTHRVEKSSTNFIGRSRLFGTPRKRIVDELHAPTIKNGDSGLPQFPNGINFTSDKIIDISAEITGTIASNTAGPNVALPTGFTYTNAMYMYFQHRQTGGSNDWWGGPIISSTGVTWFDSLRHVIKSTNQYQITNNHLTVGFDYKFRFIRFT